MNAKRWLTGMVFFLSCMGLMPDDIVHSSRLERASKELSVKRDLFMPGRPASVSRGAESGRPIPAMKKTPEPEEGRTKPEEARIRRVMVFEGFIHRNNRLTGILSVNGEYFIVEEGEWIMDGVQVQALNEKSITVLVEGSRVVVQFQGVDENEK